ncbi:glycoside hydrolase family 1 protein [Prescottella sp. R16]|uniref:glycoside hydrolase family 1 protein n=1 Tax=Prescottella sp. R16 TaxID=3064529 RepID=UPI00272E94BA|nr:family 1 glycosylhydrolase [Prescottella sp. R16]
MTKTFPEKFLWGAATAPYQVEGNNLASDLWAMEHMPESMFSEPSGDTVDFYSRYPQDIALLADLGLNTLRLGVEWARIEPEPGQISNAQLDHYERVVDRCLERKVEPVVTLHHFSSPKWIIPRHGWKNPELAERYADHAHRVGTRLGDRVAWYCTFNEVNTPMQMVGNGLLSPAMAELLNPARRRAAEYFGVAEDDFVPFFPYADSEEAIKVVLDAHRRGVDAVHAANSNAMVGVTLSMQEHFGLPGGEEQAAHVDEIVNRRWLRDAGSIGDFVGVQNYGRISYDETGRLHGGEHVMDNMLPMVPSTLGATVREAAEITGKPILVTEHGADLTTDRDELRIWFLRNSLDGLVDAIADGVDVRGYIHWCLTDNWEWFKGYTSHFGLHEVDRATQERIPRPSAAVFGEIARANAI